MSIKQCGQRSRVCSVTEATRLNRMSNASAFMSSSQYFTSLFFSSYAASDAVATAVGVDVSGYQKRLPAKALWNWHSFVLIFPDQTALSHHAFFSDTR